MCGNSTGLGCCLQEKTQEGTLYCFLLSLLLTRQTCIWQLLPVLDITVQSSTLSNCPSLLGIIDLPMVKQLRSFAVNWKSQARCSNPLPYSQIMPRSHTRKLHFCCYIALLNRCLLVTSFLFSAHLFLCKLTPYLLMLLLAPWPEEKQHSLWVLYMKSPEVFHKNWNRQFPEILIWWYVNKLV